MRRIADEVDVPRERVVSEAGLVADVGLTDFELLRILFLVEDLTPGCSAEVIDWSKVTFGDLYRLHVGYAVEESMEIDQFRDS